MARADLLALTHEDLAALTNRGTVKRAARELDSGEVTFTLAESDAGEVRVDWSDNAKCVLPAGKTVSEGRCNCPATTICRHVVRSVLAYQQHASTSSAAATTTRTPEPWNPGDITDDQLAEHFKKTALAAAQTRFEQRILVELIRSAKPTARFHQLACTLRFVVPGDVRYTHCDCAETAPCSHVPLAVWAFRQLPPDQAAGVVATQIDEMPVPAELLDAGDALLLEMAEAGVSGLPPSWKDRVLRLSVRCEQADLAWPAGILSELVQQYERYTTHDARFAPDRVAELVGEWLIRASAIRGQTRSTPQILIRGSSSDRTTDIGSARYVGIGCGAHVGRGGVSITAYLQDSDSGSVAAVSRDFADPAKDAKEQPKDLSRLAQTPVMREISLAALGAGQLLLQGGKRAPDHRLIVGRARASANPQSYAWESLRAPVLAEDFAELRVRLAALPPASLRPRYVAADLHVVPVESVDAAHFDEACQAVHVFVRDARHEGALVLHPYVARAASGAETLMAALADPTQRLRFIAGHVRQSPRGLLVHPVTLVFEKDGLRSGVQPWVDRGPTDMSGGESLRPPPNLTGDFNPVEDFAGQLLNDLGELFLLGLRRADVRVARSWAALAHHGQSLGYHRIVMPVLALGEELARKLSTPRWEPKTASRSVLEISLYAKLAQDLR